MKLISLKKILVKMKKFYKNKTSNLKFLKIKFYIRKQVFSL